MKLTRTPMLAALAVGALYAGRKLWKYYKEDASLSRAEASVIVDVPVRTAYNQWTQFEEFPKFMEGVREVTQLDDKRLHWRAEIGGVEKEWDAEITRQIPDKRIAWRSIGGAPNAGVVRFEPVAESKTKVIVNLSYEPEGILEDAADSLGIVKSRIEGDVKRFKEYIETRGTETGAWRGAINPDKAESDVSTNLTGGPKSH